jgi:hypothetical protein
MELSYQQITAELADDIMYMLKSLKEMGWDCAKVHVVDHRIELHIADTLIAAGENTDPVIATELLLDRVADLFILNPINV